jgi:hypothetical protein
MNTNVNFPFQFDGRGRTLNPQENYLRQLVEQVLFTSPGERVNLPDFKQRPAAASLRTLQSGDGRGHRVHRAGRLAEVASNYVRLQSVTADVEEAKLTVTVIYSPLSTDVTEIQTFVYGGAQ